MVRKKVLLPSLLSGVTVFGTPRVLRRVLETSDSAGNKNFKEMVRKKVLLPFLIFGFTGAAIAQSADSTSNEKRKAISKSTTVLSGYALATHNGINLVPTFSLNKPAAMFKFSAARNRFSFEPEFNFSLEGRPWYFLFWLRYKLVQTKKFRLNTAGQLGLNFRKVDVLVNSGTVEGTVTDRYLAGEFAPSYQLTKNLTVGIYYIHSHGLDPGTTNSLDFLTFNATLANLKITEEIRLKFTPQFYYLHQDDKSGTYFTSSLALTREGFPLSLSSIINQPIQTNIVGGNNFGWNVALVYSFAQ